jgi:hypothetical protein
LQVECVRRLSLNRLAGYAADGVTRLPRVPRVTVARASAGYATLADRTGLDVFGERAAPDAPARSGRA